MAEMNFDYTRTMARLEYRSGAPLSFEEIPGLVDSIEKAGFDGWWYSAFDHEGLPIYESKTTPYSHPRACSASLRALADEAHKRGITLMTWYPMSVSKPCWDAHPDWRMKLLQYGPDAPEPTIPFLCFNSPYREAVAGIVREVVGELDWDGVWFDGNFYGNIVNPFWPGCKCGFCQERFQKDTGRQIPEKVDFSNKDFRIFVNWRFQIVEEFWQAMVQAAREVKPSATIGFNTLNRRMKIWPGWDWNSGVPLKHVDIDGLFSGENDGQPFQTIFQVKSWRAMGGKRPAECWHPLFDFHGAGSWTPEPEAGTAIQHTLACITAGAIPAFGYGYAPDQAPQTFPRCLELSKERGPWVGGEPMPYAGLLLSGQTQSFAYQDKGLAFWDSAHGFHELLEQAHLPSEIVYDNQLNAEYLAQFPVLVLSNAVCLSAAQAKEIEQYVANGGLLVATAHTGEADELGYAHPTAILDKLLGIERRIDASPDGFLDSGLGTQPNRQLIWKPLQAWSNAPGDERRYVIPGGVCIGTKAAQGANILATGGILPAPLEEAVQRWDAVLHRSHGKGDVLYLNGDVGYGFMHEPRTSTRRYVAQLLTALRRPAISAETHPQVSIAPWQITRDEIRIHILNYPGLGSRYPMGLECCAPEVEEIAPIDNVVLTLNGFKVKEASLALSGTALKVTQENGIYRISIPRLELHEIVRVQLVV